MSILKNASESIQVGMEDYHNDDPRRVLSAIRNLYAGILLLFKYKLQLLSPDGSDEALLKTKVLPSSDPESGEVSWVGQGKKTVDVRDIIERLQSLGVKDVDFKLLTQLQNIRNDIEHYYSPLPVERMKEAVANALHLIIQFCKPHLDEEPVGILGQECWEQMLEVATVYDAELKTCVANLEAVQWPFQEVKNAVPYMRCPACTSQLIKAIDLHAVKNSIRLSCSSCHQESDYTDVAGPAVAEYMEGENHWHMRKGGEPMSQECPECEHGAFLVAEEQCAACFFEFDATHCEWCEERLTYEERLDGSVCGYCQHRYDRIMAE